MVDDRDAENHDRHPDGPRDARQLALEGLYHDRDGRHQKRPGVHAGGRPAAECCVESQVDQDLAAEDEVRQLQVERTSCPVGVRPDTELAADAGAELGTKGAIVVDRQMRINLPDVLAAGDCVTTHHRLSGISYLPLGTTAHKQGRIAGENALGGTREFADSLGTQVVKVFDLVAARTGLRDHEATAAGFDPATVASEADDHKAYYPGSHKIAMRYTGDRRTGQLLGVQLVGHLGSEIAKRIDIPATAIFNRMTVEALSDLDLSYTPPLGSPWDASKPALKRGSVRRRPCRRQPPRKVARREQQLGAARRDQCSVLT